LTIAKITDIVILHKLKGEFILHKSSEQKDQNFDTGKTKEKIYIRVDKLFSIVYKNISRSNVIKFCLFMVPFYLAIKTTKENPLGFSMSSLVYIAFFIGIGCIIMNDLTRKMISLHSIKEVLSNLKGIGQSSELYDFMRSKDLMNQEEVLVFFINEIFLLMKFDVYSILILFVTTLFFVLSLLNFMVYGFSFFAYLFMYHFALFFIAKTVKTCKFKSDMKKIFNIC